MSFKPSISRRSSSLLAAAACAALALASAPGIATAQSSVVSRSVTTTTSGGNTVRVESTGTEYTITLNGKEISRGAITDKTWRTFEVTDESGAKIAEISRTGSDFTISMLGDGADTDADSDWAPADSLADLAQIERRVAEGARGSMARAFARMSSPPRTMLGVNLEQPSEAMAAQLGIDRENSTILTNVNDGLPAAKAGLRKYDIITEVDGKPASPEQVRKALREKNPGDTLNVKVVRGSERKDISITLEAYDARRVGAAAWSPDPGSWAGPGGAFTLNLDPQTELMEERARAMENLAAELEERARSAAEKANESQSRALEDLNRQMEEIARQLAAKAEEMARAHSGFGSGTPGFRILGRGASGQALPLVVPAPPNAPLPPALPAGPDGAEVETLKQRMDTIDRRLADLTALLEKAVAEKGASAGSDPAKNN